MKKVSVIIPVYNKELYLDRCIKSILNQTYKNIEVLLINDGSKDKSLDVIKKWERKDKRIIVIDKKNEGAAKTRNLGISKSSGEYITFVDADDYLDSKFISVYVNAISENDIVLGGYKRVNDEKVLFKQELIETQWSKYIIVSTWAKMYRKSFLLSNKIEFLQCPIGEDVYFYISALKFDPLCKIVNGALYNWYDDITSLTNTIYKGFNKSVDVMFLLNNFKSKLKKDEYSLYFMYRFIIYHLLYAGKNSSKTSFLLEYNKIRKWRKDNELIRCPIFPFSKKLKGEIFKHRFFVLSFVIIEKLKLINIFAKIYCKGEK